MTKKFAKIPAALKTGLITDILLFVCFVWLGISGILISHMILTGISSQNMDCNPEKERDFCGKKDEIKSAKRDFITLMKPRYACKQ